jgi:hypothetical protein
MLEPDRDHGLHTLMLALQADFTGRAALSTCNVLHGRHHEPPPERLMSAVSYKCGFKGMLAPEARHPAIHLCPRLQM